MTDIYEQHASTFIDVAAFVVLGRTTDDKGNPVRVANVALKFAKSGLRTTAYVHWFGVGMVKGIANGGGYDKATAAVSAAVSKLPAGLEASHGLHADPHHDYVHFRVAAMRDGGKTWLHALEDAGFTVLQAV